MNNDENVLCIKNDTFNRMKAICEDLLLSDLEAMERLGSIYYIPRSVAETDETFRQIIPYILLIYNDENHNQFVFTYMRDKGVGEKRLSSKYSFGFGGHLRSGETFREGIKRELIEEVGGIDESIFEWNGLTEKINIYYYGIGQTCISMDDTPVDRVHIGFPLVVEMNNPAIWSNERELIQCGWRSWDWIYENRESFDNWSRFLIDKRGGFK